MKRLIRGIISKRIKTAIVLAWVLAAAMLVVPNSGFCEDPVANESVEALIQLLQQKGIISAQEADTFLQRLQQVPSDDDGTVQQELEETRQELDRSVDQLLQRDRLTERKLEELDTKVKDEIATQQYKSSWAQRTKISGDFRLRYQNDFKSETNEDRLGESGAEPTNIDRERYRYRARLGVKTKLMDPRESNNGQVEAGLRLSTGNENDPVSTNETIGDYNNKDQVVFDRAYLKWSRKPEEQIWGSKIPEMALIGGRMANPFFGTDLVWDSDLNFEGLGLSLVSDTYEGNSWRAFITAGAFPLDEYEFREEGKWLYGAQVGIEHKPFWGLNYKLAVAYYDYENVQGESITSIPTQTLDADWGAPGAIGGGNTLVQLNQTGDARFDVIGLVSDYNEVNATAMIDIDRFFPVHIIITADYVVNVGYDKDEVLSRDFDSLIPETALDQTEGYQFGLLIGYPKVRAAGEWNASFHYKYLEADAVLDAFTDSDFNSGGTDSEGYIFKCDIGLYQNVWLTGRYISSNEILTEERGQFAVDTLQIDINARF